MYFSCAAVLPSCLRISSSTVRQLVAPRRLMTQTADRCKRTEHRAQTTPGTTENRDRDRTEATSIDRASDFTDHSACKYKKTCSTLKSPRYSSAMGDRRQATAWLNERGGCARANLRAPTL
eukprot:scaffold4574_cov143-Isochrysis_galbana.AAC.1